MEFEWEQKGICLESWSSADFQFVVQVTPKKTNIRCLKKLKKNA